MERFRRHIKPESYVLKPCRTDESKNWRLKKKKKRSKLLPKVKLKLGRKYKYITLGIKREMYVKGNVDTVC